jgi:DNA-nicking Smr family endonuclease
MSDGKDNDNSTSNKHLNDEDRIIWKKVSDTAKPLKKRPELSARAKNTDKTGRQKPPPKTQFRGKNPQPPSAPSYIPMRQTSISTAPALGVDKAMKRKLGRGQMEIDARLDLHGKTKATAHRILKSFLLDAQMREHRTVLIITGKGDQGLARHTLHSFDVIHTPERTGILMRSVPQWLNEPDFRNLIVGFQPAHPKHGGGGALYVRLRRKR